MSDLPNPSHVIREDFSAKSLPKVHDLLKSPDGSRLVGFANDFLSSSIATTIQFPQTQSVIKIAIAATLLRASRDGKSSEIIILEKDLKEENDRIIDLKSVSEFVADLYQRKGFNIPFVPI